MVELLSRPRVFVLAFWITSMFISGVLGGLLMNFDSGTVTIWLALTLLGPALVWGMLSLQSWSNSPSTTARRPEAAQASVSRRRSAPRSAAAQAPRP